MMIKNTLYLHCHRKCTLSDSLLLYIHYTAYHTVQELSHSAQGIIIYGAFQVSCLGELYRQQTAGDVMV